VVAGLLPTTMVDCSLRVGGSSTDEWQPRVLAVEVLGWVGSALLVYSVLQARILRLHRSNRATPTLRPFFPPMSSPDQARKAHTAPPDVPLSVRISRSSWANNSSSTPA
jgi:hypothetical protein